MFIFDACVFKRINSYILTNLLKKQIHMRSASFQMLNPEATCAVLVSHIVQIAEQLGLVSTNFYFESIFLFFLYFFSLLILPPLPLSHSSLSPPCSSVLIKMKRTFEKQ